MKFNKINSATINKAKEILEPRLVSETVLCSSGWP